MPQNTAAYLTSLKKYPLEVKTAPYTAPQSSQIVIRSRAVAVNPYDYFIQENGNMVTPWLKYPAVLGTDVSGEVVEIGKAITRFKVGDRVVSHALGVSKNRDGAAAGAFQEYVLLEEHMTSPIPDSMTFESASVIPLGASTAACGLFEKDQLGLDVPTGKVEPNGKTVLVWGGSTSVGCNAIQMAKAAGYQVITTASPKNFAMVKDLGAAHVFDYNSKTVVKDIIQVLQGGHLVGALSIGANSADPCLDILHKTKGDKKFIMITYLIANVDPNKSMAYKIAYYLCASIRHWFITRMRGIKSTAVFGDTLADNGIGKAFYADYLPTALANGSFKPSPEAAVAGHGLDKIQAAMDTLKNGVSGKKIVVTL